MRRAEGWMQHLTKPIICAARLTMPEVGMADHVTYPKLYAVRFLQLFTEMCCVLACLHPEVLIIQLLLCSPLWCSGWGVPTGQQILALAHTPNDPGRPIGIPVSSVQHF